jgi:hypothetical protein
VRQLTAKVNRGLRTLASIVENLRRSVGEIDDPDEESDIQAALRWINGIGSAKAALKQRPSAEALGSYQPHAGE